MTRQWPFPLRQVPGVRGGRHRRDPAEPLQREPPRPARPGRDAAGTLSGSPRALDAGLGKLPQSVRLRWIGREVVRFNGQPERVPRFDEEIRQFVTQFAWRYSDFPNQLDIARLMLDQGVDPKKVLSGIYGPIKKREPNYADVHIASGDLALEKSTTSSRLKRAYEQAVKIDPENADAHFGLARAFAPSDDEKVPAGGHRRSSQNPRHVGALLLVVDNHVDAERYADAEKVLAEIESVNPHHPRALAYRAVLAHLNNKLDRREAAADKALQFWKQNPEVDYLIGKKLSQKYRFARRRRTSGRRLAFDGKFLAAKSQLAQDLLRLGRKRKDSGWARGGLRDGRIQRPRPQPRGPAGEPRRVPDDRIRRASSFGWTPSEAESVRRPAGPRAH